MISKLKGQIDDIKDDTVIFSVNGISYEIQVPSSLPSKLRMKMMGENEDGITFHTIYYIEGKGGYGNLSPKLIGFLTPVDREFFELFTQVSGFGVKKGLKALTVPISKIAFAIESGNIRALTDLPGIGRRTANKIIAELRGKMAKFALMKEDEQYLQEKEKFLDFKSEALEILLQLDYKKHEAEEMISTALEKNKKITNSEELIKEIFKQKKID